MGSLFCEDIDVHRNPSLAEQSEEETRPLNIARVEREFTHTERASSYSRTKITAAIVVTGVTDCVILRGLVCW